jgi:hypothetical protein
MHLHTCVFQIVDQYLMIVMHKHFGEDIYSPKSFQNVYKVKFLSQLLLGLEISLICSSKKLPCETDLPHTP